MKNDTNAVRAGDGMMVVDFGDCQVMYYYNAAGELELLDSRNPAESFIPFGSSLGACLNHVRLSVDMLVEKTGQDRATLIVEDSGDE